MEKESKKVLIVDDEEDMREVLGDKFSTCGFEVELAENGKEGLKMAKKWHPSVIVLDIIMPKMDGTSMLRELRRDAWGKSVPVVVLTNISDTKELDEINKIGIQSYMLKAEWNLSSIVENVKETISR